MPTLLALLLSLCGCRPNPPVTASAAPAASPSPATAPSESVETTKPTGPVDFFAPFPVASQLQIRTPDFLVAAGLDGGGAGVEPINTEEDDRDFFTDPAFDQEGYTGRLFCKHAVLSNRYKPDAPTITAAFICWQPIHPEAGGGMLAQLLPWREGYDVYDVTTDGKQLMVQFEPGYGTKNPGRPIDIYVWKGDKLGKGRFVPKDNKPFPKLNADAPQPFEEERARGFEAVAANDYQEAVERFEAAIKQKPDDASSYYGLGLAHIGSGQPAGSERARKAIAAFTKAVTLDPKRAEAWRERAVLYWMEKQYDKAVADSTKVIAIKPKDAQSYIERAQWFGSMETPEGKLKAIADIKTATKLAPEEREYWEILCRFQYEAGRYEDAVKSAGRALDRDDSRNVARVVLACIAARQGNKEKALKLIQATHDNGITYDERRDGLRTIQKALTEQPNSPALKAIYSALSGPDQLEPTED